MMSQSTAGQPPASQFPAGQPLALGELPLAVLRGLPAAVFVFDGGARLAMANAAAYDMLGMTPDLPMEGRSLADITRLMAYRGLYGQGDPEGQAAAALALDRGQPHRRTARATDGRWFDLFSEPLPGGGWLSLVTDITLHRRALEASQARERLTDQALRHHPSGLGLYDAEHRLVLFNEAYERILEVPPGTLRAGLSFEAVFDLMAIHQAMTPQQIDELRRYRLSINRRRPHEQVRQRPDGRAIRSISQPMPDGGFLVSLQDVTELQQARDDANRRASLLDGVLAALPHGVCVYGPDRRLAMVNEAYQRLLQGAELKVGEHLMDICRRREAQGEYEPGVTAETVFRRQFQFSPMGRERRRPDGTIVCTHGAILPDGGHIAVVSDVTPLRRAEAAAQQRARLLQAMLDSMRHGVCLFDAEHKVVAANALAARMAGLRPEDMAPGTPLSVLRALQYASGEFGAGPAADELYTTRANTLVPRLDRYSRTRPDGTVIEITTDPTPDGGYVRTYADVTEERRARAAIEHARVLAEEANAAKSRFLATMSHELRTPLNAVIGFSEALLAEPGGAHVGEFAGTILEAGRHLLSLIDEILEVAKAGTGTPAAATRPLFLPSVLEGAVRLMGNSAEAAGVVLAAEPLPALPRVLADERRLRQVLLNLLSNAVKFTPRGGTVRIGAEALPEGGVEVRIADNGIGIEEGQLERAFEPFVQLETSHARRYAGSGLGLYLARALAQSMGATLTLESARGEGTVARLRLEAAEQQQEQTA
ncbi:hypothetical protein CR162_14270 [Pseudoroseomonas rhizosphaerae]|uniref:histidine kinase n=1 Tax=Teichococcus rhizosphaerae TaxID=1335062 RepID=A0A2C6Y0H8_9PROT|nr:PAS domain-containing sensor histidine kinase [Pseudoroseomonas rhizosphaerae]PHK94292.1 hypothetical protein CR162_14270 [Pseudoroseomonas rhizosphaerae]